MARTLKTAAEIQAFVHGRIHAMEQVKQDGATIRVPPPRECEPGADGCNWDMEYFGNAAGYEDGIRVALNEAQERFLLQS